MKCIFLYTQKYVCIFGKNGNVKNCNVRNMPRKHIHVWGTARRRDNNIDKMKYALRDVIENGFSFGTNYSIEKKKQLLKLATYECIREENTVLFFHLF